MISDSPKKSSSAIYYHPEAYTTSGPKLMGRNAAGESFLRGFFAHSRASELWAQVETPAHGQRFAQAAAEARPGLPVHTLTRAQLGALAQPGWARVSVWTGNPGRASAAACAKRWPCAGVST